MTTEPDVSTATRYRLDVIAPRLADLVQYTGGWLFDHVMAGWDVTALLPECSDPRPLHILGVRVAIFNDEPGEDCGRVATTVAVCEAIYRERAGVRRQLAHAAEHGSEVVLWPGDPVVHTVPKMGQMHHRLTRAACVFKAEALRALTGGRATAPSERLEWFQCLTCNSAASSPEAGFMSSQMPRRAFKCCPSSPASVACDRPINSESTVTRRAERRLSDTTTRRSSC